MLTNATLFALFQKTKLLIKEKIDPFHFHENTNLINCYKATPKKRLY